jgi:hypothetical protein
MSISLLLSFLIVRLFQPRSFLSRLGHHMVEPKTLLQNSCCLYDCAPATNCQRRACRNILPSQQGLNVGSALHRSSEKTRMIGMCLVGYSTVVVLNFALSAQTPPILFHAKICRLRYRCQELLDNVHGFPVAYCPSSRSEALYTL